MSQLNFYTNTAMLCYNCGKVAVVRLAERGNSIRESDLLEIYYVSCAACLRFSTVHNPLTSIFPRYIDPRRYSEAIKSLAVLFGCPQFVPQRRLFSITACKIKRLARIRDVNEIFDIEKVPESNIRILKYNATDTRFFAHESLVSIGEPFGYQQIDAYIRQPSQHSQMDDCLDEKIAIPIDSMIEWPQTMPRLQCPSCVSGLSRDLPPAYSSQTRLISPEKVLLELVGKCIDKDCWPKLISFSLTRPHQKIR